MTFSAVLAATGLGSAFSGAGSLWGTSTRLPGADFLYDFFLVWQTLFNKSSDLERVRGPLLP